jgi:hypothetical protein
MRVIVAVLVSLTVASCGLARQRELQAQMEGLKAKAVAAYQQCDLTYPPGNAKAAVARAKCQNDAFAIIRPIMPYQDLIDLLSASRIAIAERVQNGELTIAQANELIATKQSELVAEEQRRNLANRAVLAQEGVAAASLAAAGPHSCTRLGNTVNCF